QVTGHAIHRVGQVLPRTGDPRHLGLAAELTFRAYFAGHARYFRGEGGELIDHRIYRAGDTKELTLERTTLNLERDTLREVALGDRADHARHFRRRVHQVVDQR